jgi:hypothetical protein
VSVREGEERETVRRGGGVVRRKEGRDELVERVLFAFTVVEEGG